MSRPEDRSVLHLSDARRFLLLGSVLVDSLGSGLWMPFSLIFFTRALGQSAATAGAALTVGGLLGLGVGLRSGAIVDRRGPGIVLVVSTVLRAGTFALYPFVHSAWVLIVAVLVTAAADRMFWTANAPMIGMVFAGRAMDRFLGLTGMIRVIGLGVGAAAAGTFGGSVTGLHAIAFINAASFAAAALLLAVVLGPGGLSAQRPDPAPETQHGRPTESAATVTSVWCNGPYLWLCAIQVIFVLAASSFVTILPLVVLDVMHGPMWLPGASIVAANIVLAAAQSLALKVAERHSRAAMLYVAAGFYVVALLAMAPGARLGSALVAPVVIAVAVLGGVGEVISAPLMISAANQTAPEGHKGRYSGVFQTGWGLANVVGPLVYTSLLTLGNAVLWIVLAVVTLAVLPVLARLRYTLPPAILHTAPEREDQPAVEPPGPAGVGGGGLADELGVAVR